MKDKLHARWTNHNLKHFRGLRGPPLRFSASKRQEIRRQGSKDRSLFDSWADSVAHWLNRFQILPRELVFDVAGVQRRGRFEQHHFAFFFREWSMLNAARHDDELALFDPVLACFSVIAIVHAETTFHDQKHFIFVFVMVP